MITIEQTAMLVDLHKRKDTLNRAISDINRMKITNDKSYRDIIVHTHDGNNGRNISLANLLTIEEIFELRDQIVCKLIDKLEDINEELNSLILSKTI